MRSSGLSQRAWGACAGAALFALAFTGAAVGGEAKSSSAPPAAPSEETMARAKAKFEDACGNCHDLYVTTDQRKNRAGWEKTLGKMVGYGAPISDTEAHEILDYLSTQYAAAN